MTPTTGTDLLDVNGTLAIENGAAIDITRSSETLPGDALDIVTADAIHWPVHDHRTSRPRCSASSSRTGNRIQIRSEFDNDGDYPTNVQASVDYANQVLRDGYGVQAFTNALNVLTAADGTVNQQRSQLARRLTVRNRARGRDGPDHGRQCPCPEDHGARAGRPLQLLQALTGKSELDGKNYSGAARTYFSNQGYWGSDMARPVGA